MANKEEKTKPPAYIDYTSDSSTASSDEYSAAHFYDYWKRALIKTHRMSTNPLTIKERSLWKRLYTQYSADDLIRMIDYWMNMPSRKRKYSPADFVLFYCMTSEIYSVIKQKDYSWE